MLTNTDAVRHQGLIDRISAGCGSQLLIFANREFMDRPLAVGTITAISASQRARYPPISGVARSTRTHLRVFRAGSSNSAYSAPA